jgi:hypothetical protein
MHRLVIIFSILLILLGRNCLQAQKLKPWSDKSTCLFGYKNEQKEWAIPAKYSYAADFNDSTGLAVVGIGEKYGLIGSDGRLRTKIQYKDIGMPFSENTDLQSNWYYSFSDGKNYGLMDTSGKIILSPRFKDEIRWKSGRFIGIPKGFADTSGKLIATGIEIGSFHEGFLIFSINKNISHAEEDYMSDVPGAMEMVKSEVWLYGIMDTSGKVRLPAQYLKIQDCYSDLLIQGINGKYGLAERNGTLLVPVQYDEEEQYTDYDYGRKSLITFTKNGLYYFYDMEAHQMLFSGFGAATQYYYGSGMVYLQDHHKYGLGRPNGSVLFAPVYDEFPNVTAKLIIVKKNGRYDLIDTSGHILAEGLDEITATNRKDIFIAKKNGLYTLMDEEGKFISEGLEEIKASGKDSLWFIKKGGLYGLMDIKGNYVLPPEYGYIEALGGGYYPYYVIGKNGFQGLVALSGKACLPPSFDYLEFDEGAGDSITLTAIKEGKALSIVLRKDSVQLRRFKGSPDDALHLYSGFYEREVQLVQNCWPVDPSDEFAAGREDQDKADSLIIPNPSAYFIEKKSARVKGIKSYVLDKEGKVLLYSTEYVFGNYFGKGVIAIFGPSGMGLMSLKGRIILPAHYKEIRSMYEFYGDPNRVYSPPYITSFHLKGEYSYNSSPDQYIDGQPSNIQDSRTDGFYYFQSMNNQVGVLDSNFNIVLPAIYKAVSDFQGCWFVQPGNELLLNMLSADGKRILLKGLKNIPGNGHAGLFSIEDEHVHFAFFNRNGVFVSAYRYDEIKPTRHSRYMVSEKGKTGLMDSTGKIVLPLEYDIIVEAPYSRYFVMKTGKAGLIEDSSLKTVLPCENDEIGRYMNGYALLRRHGKWGILDSTGHVIVEPAWKTPADLPLSLDSLYGQSLTDTREAVSTGNYNVKNAHSHLNIHLPGTYSKDSWNIGIFCHTTPKTVDSLPGIATKQYAGMEGYYELLSRYPDENDRKRINNFCINYLLNHDGLRPAKEEFQDPRDVFYVNVRFAADIIKNMPRRPMHCGYSAGLENVSHCKQTDYSLVCLSRHIVALKEEFSYGEPQYRYIYLQPDSVEVLKPERMFSSDSWKDTLAWRYQKILEKNTPESPYCSSPEQKTRQRNDQFTHIRQELIPPVFKLDKNGISWDISDYTHGQYQKTTILLKYAELESLIKPEGPLKELL